MELLFILKMELVVYHSGFGWVLFVCLRVFVFCFLFFFYPIHQIKTYMEKMLFKLLRVALSCHHLRKTLGFIKANEVPIFELQSKQHCDSSE